MKKIVITIIIFCCSAALYSSNGGRALFEQGMEAFRSGNFGSSELLFRRVLDLNDDEFADRAWFYFARSIYEQKNYRSSIYEFSSYLNKCRTADLCIESRYWIAEAYYYQNEYIKSIEEFRRYISRSSDSERSSSAHDRIAAIYSDQKRYDEAVIELEEAIKKSTDRERNAMRVVRISELLLSGKEYEKALERINPVLTSTVSQNTSARARIAAARIHQQTGNHARALILLNGISRNIARDPAFNEVNYFKALSLIESGQMRNARTLLEAFVQGEKTSRWYYHGLYRLAMLYMEEKDSSGRGIELLEEVRSQAGDSELVLTALRQLAAIYIESGPKKAIDILEGNAAAAEDSGLLLLLGRAYIEAGRLVEAEGVLKTFREKFPFDKRYDEVSFLIGRIHLERGDHDSAVDVFRKIKTDNPFSPYNVESEYYLGIASFKKGEYSSAASTFTAYLKEKDIQREFQARAMLAESYIRSGDLKRAGDAVDYIIRYHSGEKGTENTIYSYALALMDKGIKAQKYVDLILKSYSGTRPAYLIYYRYAEEAMAARKYARAEDYYKRYLSGNESSMRGRAFYRRLTALFELKRYEELASEMDRPEKKPPMDEAQWKSAIRMTAESYYKLERYEEAYNQFSIINNGGEDKNLQFMFALSSAEVGDIQTAERLIQGFLDDPELYSKAMFAVASYYLKKGNSDEALSIYSEITVRYPGAEYADHSRLEFARVLISRNRFREAIEKLKDVKSPSVRPSKNALLVVSYFKVSEPAAAIEITGKDINSILKTEFGEDAVKASIEYYYSVNDFRNFRLFAGYMKRYEDSSYYIAFMNGKMQYQNGRYSTAYRYFIIAFRAESAHAVEAGYYLGVISLLVNRNRAQAEKYFNDIIELDADSEYSYRAKIQLAILYYDDDKKKESERLLNDVAYGPRARFYNVQALNLLEHYGFNSFSSASGIDEENKKGD